MARFVLKFGGTSVGSTERIKRVADRVAQVKNAGHEVAVVVSAMAGETNRLLDLVHQLSKTPDPRETDVILATGELASIALLSIALNNMGHKARSFSGLQAGILTDTAHTKARIEDIKGDAIIRYLQEGGIAVVAGFQGFSETGDITTLGRGGSDLSAVALAAAIKANVCEIFTDVDGVYTTDPNIVPTARKIERISYDEMLELASLGAKVLQNRSVELAKKANIEIHVRSTFSQETGTFVTGEVPAMEKVLVSGIALNNKEAKVSLRKVPDKPGVAAKIFSALAQSSINVDMIIQNISQDGTTDLTFTVGEADWDQTELILAGIQKEVNWQALEADANVAKISVVGIGMRSHAGVAAKLFTTLANNDINIQMISTSEIKISIVVDRKYGELALRELHQAFGLEQAAA